jgi:peptidyl-dipeptidase A
LPPASEVESLILKLEERVAPVERAVREAWWHLATIGTEEAQEELVRAGKEYNRLFADEEEYQKIRGYYEEREALESRLLRRQVEVVYRIFASRQGDEETLDRIEELEARANAIYGNHRGVVGGEETGENEIREILRFAADEARRREAWEASKTVGGEVEGTVRRATPTTSIGLWTCRR